LDKYIEGAKFDEDFSDVDSMGIKPDETPIPFSLYTLKYQLD